MGVDNMAFNQKKYTQEYNKKNYSRFLVDIPKEVKQELDKMLEEDGLTKADFLRKAIKDYKKTRSKS